MVEGSLTSRCFSFPNIFEFTCPSLELYVDIKFGFRENVLVSLAVFDKGVISRFCVSCENGKPSFWK